LTIKNPTLYVGHDVKAIISDYGEKEFLGVDAWCDLYTDGSTWDPYYVFASDQYQHGFGPGKTYSRSFTVYRPPGAMSEAVVTVDASWPFAQQEPWRISDIRFSNAEILDDGSDSTDLSCGVHDLQEDVEWVIADLTPLGGSPASPLSQQPDGSWSKGDIRCEGPVALGEKTIWIKAGGSTGDVYGRGTIAVREFVGASGLIDIRLPSDDACGPGGKLAVRLFAPGAGETQFPEGAPVVVLAPGGTSGGVVEETIDPYRSGFINISFATPGFGVPPVQSDGVHDARGEHTIAAVRDVILFALGKLEDSKGHDINEVVAAPVLSDNVGILGTSNGGPLSLITLSLYGEQLTGVKYIAGWENPTNGQIVVTDAGTGRNWIGQPPEERPKFVNPEYDAWGPVVLDIDYSSISYDSNLDAVYLERGGLDRFDVVPTGTGAVTSDVNLDGEIGDGEDWGFNYWPVETGTGGEKRYFSIEVIRALYDHSVFQPGCKPEWLPTIPEAEEFWSLRDAMSHIATMASKLPDLKLLILCSEEDHVQTAPDHPHIHQGFYGFDTNGLWVKLNPSPETLIKLNPGLEGHTDLPDYLPNEAPSDWSVPDFALPEELDEARFLCCAGLWEMAELIQSGE
jgi:hypothetical protein